MSAHLLMALMGGSATRIQLTANAFTSLTADVYWRLNSNGNEEYSILSGASYSTVEVWKQSGVTSDYDVYVTSTGDTGTGTLSTWLNLGTTRLWTVSSTAGLYKERNLTVKIRDAVSLVELTPAAGVIITLTSDRV